jgi:CRP/FNR family transcriptional regulator
MKLEAPDPARTLRRRAPWSALEEPLFQRAIAALRLRERGRGQVFFGRGDAFEELFVVAEGRVKIGLTGPDGHEIIISIATPGTTIGEAPLDESPPRYFATATALEDALAWALPRRELDRLLDESPRFARALLVLASRRVRALVELVDGIALRGVPERLAAFLLVHARRGGASGKKPFSIVRSLAVETVAGRLGTVREEVQRALRLLADEKIIALSRREIVVLDLDRLERASWEPLR